MSNKSLVTAISDIKEDEALKIVQETLDKGEDAADVLESCQEAMHIVGERFENSEYFLPELIMSGEILKRISEMIKPKLAGQADSQSSNQRAGKIVLGTVHGDIHDIGKDIVGFMLDVNGFEVHDLGVDVPEEKFVEAVKEIQPQIVALSGFLTLAFSSMKSTVEALDKAGLRDKVKVMIGGGQINEMIQRFVAADGWGTNAMEAVRMAKEWIPSR